MLVVWQCFFKRLFVFTSSTHIWCSIQRVTFPLVPLLRTDDFRIVLQRVNENLNLNPRLNWIQNKAAWLVHQHNQCFLHLREFQSVSSVAQLCPTLCDPMNCCTPGLPVHHQLLEFTQTHVHRVGDAIQPSHPLSSPSPPTFNLSEHQGIYKWVSSSHWVAKLLEFQLQHHSFQWIYRTDFL